MSTSIIKVVDISRDEYTLESTEQLIYEIKPSNLTIKNIIDKTKVKKEVATIKKLKVGEMFVIDRKSKNASTFAHRWAIRLNRIYTVRRQSDNTTEIHRVK